MTSNLLPDEDLQKLFSNEDTLNEFLEKVIERLMNEGFIQTAQNGTGSMEDTDGQGEAGGSGAPVKFELSEKGTDFLGYRALRELMGALGRSSFGSHDTQDLSTGVDASGPSKPYEFGDTMNLDVSETLLNTIRRTRSLEFKEGEGLDVGYEDLVVRQTEYRSSCATVVMLDCSPLHDPLRRGPLHAREEGGPRPLPPPPDPVPGRLAPRGPLPRLRRGDSPLAAGQGEGGSALHQHPRRPARRPADPRRASART